MSLSDFGCGSLTWVMSSEAFSIVCDFIGEPQDYASICRVNRRMRACATSRCSYIDTMVLSEVRRPLPRVRSLVIDNVALWHYGTENFQDGLILFIPPPSASEVDPLTAPVYQLYDSVTSEVVSLRNTSEVDYDSGGTSQKFRFSTAWLPTARSLYNYFECVRFLELHDFFNGLDWYLSFLDPIILGQTPRSTQSPTPSTPNSTFSTTESWSDFGGGMASPAHSLNTPPLRPRLVGALADLEEIRLVNCRTTIEDVKTCLMTPRAARRVVVVEQYTGIESFSCESSPRRRTRVGRRRPSVLRSPLPEINPIQFTTTLDMARCNTQQLEDLLLATNHLRRLVVRYLLVMDQSSLETAANPSLESMSLHCAPESTVRDTSIELATASFPALLECGIYDGPITAIGPASGILELLVLENCQIDIRTDLYLPIAKVTLKGCRLFF